MKTNTTTTIKNVMVKETSNAPSASILTNCASNFDALCNPFDEDAVRTSPNHQN